MLSEKGIIIYKLPNGKVEFKSISSINWGIGLLTISEKDLEDNVLKDIFIYDPEREKWFIPDGLDEYDEILWKEFEGEVIYFKFNTEYIAR